MATLTLKQVPEALYQRLKTRAAANRRSLNNEAIFCLEQAVAPRRLDLQQWLEKVRELRRQNPQAILTDEILHEAKNEGRP